MSILDDFSTFNFGEGVPSVSVTQNGVTFNKAVTMKLGYPEYVVLLLNGDAGQIAIRVCDKSTPNAVKFYKEKKSGAVSVRWNGKDLLNTLQYMMGWDLKKESYKTDGTLLRDENAMVFDLSKASLMN